jgi:3-oxoacyl-[acyl-carrier-protein] synthase II
MVTPLASGVQASWERLLGGESGISRIKTFNVSDIRCKIAGQLPNRRCVHGFKPDHWVARNEQRRLDDFIVYAIAAATEAVEDAEWTPEDERACERTGVIIGSGIGGIKSLIHATTLINRRGPARLRPHFANSMCINLASGHVSIRHGFKGPNHSVVTACSTGTHAIGDAARLIQLGDADVMVAGGSEAAVCRLGIASFTAARALSTHFNETPAEASRPWDRDRDGFVMSEGAGVLVLESLGHARRRGARIYAEVKGYGMSGDAYHITTPPVDGNGGFRSMQAALANARMNPEDIDYINAHGTSTPVGDPIELAAVTRLFDGAVQGLSMSSTKSSIGHLLGAAGSVEAIFSVLAIVNGVVPPTLNLHNPPPGCGIDLVPHRARERSVRATLSNSFGFGGTNASLVFAAYG